MGRSIIPILEDWYFDGNPVQTLPPFSISGEAVTLPHTWNTAADCSYHRGTCLYTRELNLEKSLLNQDLYLEFLGVNSVASVYLNDRLLGTHRGGYSAFRFDITEAYDWNGSNTLAVLADNSETEDVSPLFGDFTIFGGIYREVRVLAVPKTHFDALHYGTQGITLLTDVDEQNTGIIRLEARGVRAGAGRITYCLYDPAGSMVLEQTVPAREQRTVLTVPDVTLWNGRENPALYLFRAVLTDGSGEEDAVELPCGFRRCEMTGERGFCLNGEKLMLHGVGIHHDREGMGNAVTREEREEDFRLIDEMGANMIRLTHYQHAPYIYDMCDRDGFVVWTEIPMLSMTEEPALLENARQQLTELILQNCHHPSIFFWGIQNEIAMFGENQYMYGAVESLNELAKQLDPTRLTACANLHNVKPESHMNHITDTVGYNLYYGWYYGEIPEYQEFFDEFHRLNPEVPLGISEYGVDCNLAFHSDTPKRKDYSEEFQCLFHEQSYGIMEKQTWLWGTVIWNMFDFGSAIRNEGGTRGKNAKGLVSGDRKVKKDAFYFYRACWSRVPFIHITGRRYKKRWKETVAIKVYSNQRQIRLYVNGRFVKEQRGERVFLFEGIRLLEGENRIEARCGGFQDEIILKRGTEPVPEYTYIDPNPGFNVKNWFLKDSEEMDPDRAYSLWDTVGDLKNNSEAWALLKAELPGLWEDPTFEKRTQYVLFKLINRASSRFEEETVKQVNEKLMKIQKKGDGR